MKSDRNSEIITENDSVYVLQTSASVFIKTATLCAMTGKTKQWIGQLVSDGILHQHSTPHGLLFDATEAVRAYCIMLEERAKEKGDKETIAAEKEKLNADVSIKKAKAIISVLEAKELQGKMHRSEDVQAVTEDFVYTIRSLLLALPGRLAMDTAAASTPAETAEIIRKEVFALMETCSRYRYDSKKYEERVRERQKWDKNFSTDDDGEED